MTEHHVRVPERGSADVSPAAWQHLEADSSFWHLVERGILSVSRPTAGRVRLNASCYVGRAVCSGVILEVHEKVPHSLSALLGYATHDAFRLERAKAAASDLGNLASLIISQFLDGVTAYVSAGRTSQYTRIRRRSALAGGRLDILGTVRLRTRGLGHLLSFERDTLSHNTRLNRVLFAAVHEIERISQLVSLPDREIARARGLTVVLSDCRDYETLFRERSFFVVEGVNLARATSNRSHQDLLALAGLILAHESFEHQAHRAARSPRAWFLNLETLFEQAVLATAQRLADGDWTIASGKRASPRIFSRVKKEHRAEPDLVMRSDLHGCFVGDAKYKTWEGKAKPADLYQVLVHAAAFDASTAFLVYPGEAPEVHSLGRSATGSESWVFVVDPRELSSHVALILGKLRVPVINSTKEDEPKVA